MIRYKWQRILTVNCYAIERTNRSTGIMNNRAKSPNAFNMNTLCICKCWWISIRSSWMTHLVFHVFHSLFVWTYRLVDNLPVATRVFNPETKELQFEHGYRLGQMIKGNSYINNHLKFILSYHMHTKLVPFFFQIHTWFFWCQIISCHVFRCRDKYRVVGFQVEPMSVSLSDIKFEGDSCNFPDAPKPQIVSVRWSNFELSLFYQSLWMLFFSLVGITWLKQPTVLHVFSWMEGISC